MALGPHWTNALRSSRTGPTARYISGGLTLAAILHLPGCVAIAVLPLMQHLPGVRKTKSGGAAIVAGTQDRVQT